MIELIHDELVFSFPEVHPHAKLHLDFQRTLRIPDDGRDYPLPPGLGRFPLRHVDDFAANVPAAWRERGGVMFPMFQSEAMWLLFRPDHDPERGEAYPFALKVATGKINAVTGQAWANGLNRGPQDYMVAPRQPWLDGYCVEKGVIRQFVAMPLGAGYSAEEQITGKAEHGGVQVIAYPMKRDVFERRFPMVERERVKLGYATMDDIMSAIGEHSGMQSVNLTDLNIPQSIIEMVPESVARENIIIPLSHENGVLKIVVHDPGDYETISKLQFILNKDIQPVLAAKEQIVEAINRHYGQTETESVDSMLSEFTDTQMYSRSRGYVSDRMGLAPGGRMKQEIYDDPFDFNDWDLEHSSRCFVHLTNSLAWRAMIGDAPPTIAPTARQYAQAGLPWFDYYDDAAKAVQGSGILSKLKSVLGMGQHKGETALPENESCQPQVTVPLKPKRSPNEVREGTFKPFP